MKKARATMLWSFCKSGESDRIERNRIESLSLLFAITCRQTTLRPPKMFWFRSARVFAAAERWAFQCSCSLRKHIFRVFVSINRVRWVIFGFFDKCWKQVPLELSLLLHLLHKPPWFDVTHDLGFAFITHLFGAWLVERTRKHRSILIILVLVHILFLFL